VVDRGPQASTIEHLTTGPARGLGEHGAKPLRTEIRAARARHEPATRTQKPERPRVEVAIPATRGVDVTSPPRERRGIENDTVEPLTIADHSLEHVEHVPADDPDLASVPLRAGHDLGDSIYEARLFVRGTVDSLGADCVEKEMRPEHLELLQDLLVRAGVEAEPGDFRRYGSARRLYNFNVDHAASY